MTGSPFLRLIFVWVGLLLMTLVGWRLVGRADLPPPPPGTEPPPPASHRIDFTFTAAPEPAEIRIEVSGSNVAVLHPDQWPATTSLPLPLAAEGLDLVISATWPPNTETSARALRVQAGYKAQPVVDTTLWGNPDVRDVVTLAVPRP